MLESCGYNGYTGFCCDLGINHADESTYYSHVKKIFDIQKSTAGPKKQKAHQIIKDYYMRKGITCDADGRMPIVVSLDGSYPRRGYASLSCVSFVVESFTNTIVDELVSDRCTNCKTRANKSTDGSCPEQKHHCNAGDLEGFNGLQAVENSKGFGFRYSIIVGDGDCKVFPLIAKKYPGESIKEECISHFLKRCWKRLDNCFSNAFVNILIAKFKTVPVADRKLDMVMPRYYLRKNSKELAWSYCNLIRVTLRDNGHLDTASLAMLICAIP